MPFFTTPTPYNIITAAGTHPPLNYITKNQLPLPQPHYVKIKGDNPNLSHNIKLTHKNMYYTMTAVKVSTG